MKLWVQTTPEQSENPWKEREESSILFKVISGDRDAQIMTRDDLGSLLVHSVPIEDESYF